MVIAKNKPAHICPAYRCKNRKAEKKRFCHRHHAVNQKETNLIGYTYSLLKQNAKRRKKVFTITIADFKEFCRETDYIARKGRTKLKMSIDRINPNLGYEKGNLQVLSVSENSAKQHSDAPF